METYIESNGVSWFVVGVIATAACDQSEHHHDEGKRTIRDVRGELSGHVGEHAVCAPQL